MKIAIITSGILPVPAVQGGAVENLIDFYLEYNDVHKLHDITVYSVYHPDVHAHPALQSKTNHYEYLSSTSLLFKFARRIYSAFHKKNFFYDSFLEFFLDITIRKLSSHHYDLIILENRPGFALKLSKKTRTPLVAHVHFDILNNPKYEKAFLPLSGIISVSNYLYSKAPTSIKNKCITVYNGIDLTKFRLPSTFIRQQRRKDLGIKDTDIVLVFCGRLSPIKGIKELIKAIRPLDDYIKLLVIGGSFFGNHDVEDNYIKSVKEEAAHIKERIIFTGFLPYTKIPHMLSIGDIAIIPSLCDDAFPTTTLEAMAMQLPIIATKRGGIPEQVDDSNSILIETDNNLIDNLTEAISLLVNNDDLRKKMSIASSKRSNLYDKDIYAERFFKAIDNITK